MRLVRGSKASEFHYYEWLRLRATAWPILVGLAVTLATQFATDIGTEISAPLGGLVALAAKAFQQYLTDNSGKVL